MQPTPTPNQQQQIQVPLSATSGVLCEKCDSFLFNQSLVLRKVSRFITGDEQDRIMPMVLFTCLKCDHINKDFLPEGLELNQNNDYIQLD